MGWCPGALKDRVHHWGGLCRTVSLIFAGREKKDCCCRRHCLVRRTSGTGVLCTRAVCLYRQICSYRGVWAIYGTLWWLCTSAREGLCACDCTDAGLWRPCAWHRPIWWHGSLGECWRRLFGAIAVRHVSLACFTDTTKWGWCAEWVAAVGLVPVGDRRHAMDVHA